jgi:hypothetical protein
MIDFARRVFSCNGKEVLRVRRKTNGGELEKRKCRWQVVWR